MIFLLLILIFIFKIYIIIEICFFYIFDVCFVVCIVNRFCIVFCMWNIFLYFYIFKDVNYWFFIVIRFYLDLEIKLIKFGKFFFLDYVIIVNGVFVGDIGFKFFWDVEFDIFEIGYWLGEEFWGVGIMMVVLKEFIVWVWE